MEKWGKKIRKGRGRRKSRRGGVKKERREIEKGMEEMKAER